MKVWVDANKVDDDDGGEQLAYHDTLHKMIEDTPPNVFHLWLCFPSGHQHMVRLILQCE